MTNKKYVELKWGVLFLLPQLIGLIAFSLGPVIISILLAFFKWDAIGKPVYVGMMNFKSILSVNSDFYIALKNTVYYTLLVVPLGLLLALILSVLLNNVFGKLIYRTIYFLPVVTSAVAVSMVWLWLYNSDFGVINYILGVIGIKGPKWLVDTKWVIPSISIMSIWWGLGYNITIFLAGLQNIPKVYYEAAIIDGASSFDSFIHITVPLLSPTTFFLSIISLIESFQVFDQTYIMTGGGPAKASTTLVYLIYHEGFQRFNMGYASAVSLILFIIILILTLIQIKMSKKWVHYAE